MSRYSDLPVSHSKFPPAPGVPRDLLTITLPPPKVEDILNEGGGVAPNPRPSLRPSLRPSARPSLHARVMHSLVAPPMAQPLARGLGFVAALGSALLVGAVDGVVTSAHAGERLAFGAHLLIVLHCVAVYLLVAVPWGLFCEAVINAGSWVLPARAFVAWVLEGPRRWFTPEPRLTHRMLLVLFGLGLVVGPTFPVSLAVVSQLHSKPLIALAITAVVVAMVPVALVALVLLARPLRWVLGRVGAFASPGGILASILTVAVVGTALSWLQGDHTWLDELPWGVAGYLLGLAAADLAILSALAVWRRRARSPLGWRALVAAAVVASLWGAASAKTLANRQTVAVAVSGRSALASVMVFAFQRTFDFDRDGHSALFNGGDCNDRDPRVHPGARDAPGNGVDENCSGHDAVALQEDGDGDFAPVTGPLAGARPSFVLLTVDTLRPDHLGAYGYGRPTSPNLDAFARGAARFERAYTTSPRTLRAFASVWTGRYPSRVAWGSDNVFPALEPANVTLAEKLHDAGYATAAFCNSDYFRGTVGFFQGFEDSHEGPRFKADPWQLAEQFTAWLRERERSPTPFFAWLHLLEPHHPYRDLTEPADFGHTPVDRYDEEVARADAVLRRVLGAVDAHSAAHPDRPVVVIMTADHGEALGEHGRTGHGVDLHEECVRIPLLVRAPGVAPGPRPALVSLMDVHATVLNLAGLPSGAPLHSRSLVGTLMNPAQPAAGRVRDRLFAEVTPDGFLPHEQKALYLPPWKLLWDVRRGTWELYDVEHDRAEMHNLFDDRRDVVERMREGLLTWTGEAWASQRDVLLASARLRAVPPMQNRLGVRFDDEMELLGYDLPTRVVSPGDSIRMTLYLRALAPSRHLLRLGIWFEAQDGGPLGEWFQASHFPVQGHYRTTEWAAGEILRDEVVLRVDPRERAVRMRVWFNVIEEGTLRTVAPDRGATRRNSIDLGELEIVPRR